MPPIARREDERDFCIDQALRELIARIATEIDVENHGMGLVLCQHRLGVPGIAREPNLMAAEIEQHLLDNRGDHLFILDHENIAPAEFGVCACRRLCVHRRFA